MRCSRSPISLVSKNDIGSFSSLMKKSLTSEMLMRMEMWSSRRRRNMSVAAFPVTIISSPNRISQMKPMFFSFMPTSTTDCVRNGRTSCSTDPSNKPASTRNICLRYREK